MKTLTATPGYVTACEVAPDLKRELREAIAMIDRCHCLELGREQLERCIAQGRPPGR
jgi:hypothetical protein